MKQFSIHQAKTQFSKLIRWAEQGEEVIIARGSQPVARLVAINQPANSRYFGRYADKGRIAEDFDAPLPADVLKHFE